MIMVARMRWGSLILAAATGQGGSVSASAPIPWRAYSLARLLPLVAPAQPLAELLGAVAFLRPPDQRPH